LYVSFYQDYYNINPNSKNDWGCNPVVNFVIHIIADLLSFEGESENQHLNISTRELARLSPQQLYYLKPL
jgi:hypothetical protein